MRDVGNRVVSILGGRTKELVILRPEMEAVSEEVYYTTDDGSFGVKGLVTQALATYVEVSGKPDLVIAIGPAVMMRAVAEQTRPLEKGIHFTSARFLNLGSALPPKICRLEIPRSCTGK